ncbi:MAG: hypothetical protein E7305_08640 [Butyrivibrio sp.]|nr:hypothetical protein [Butyrivibrio sp.]
MVKLIVLALIIAVLIAVIYHDTHSFKIYEYEVRSDKVSGNYTFVFLTDLHSYVFGKDNEKLIKAIDDIKPDAILSAGDMFTANHRDGKFHPEVAFSLLTRLSRKYPLYISNGNHEEKIKETRAAFGNAFERYKESLKREGLIYLDNESADFKDDIRITGLCLPTTYFKKIVKKEMESDLLDRKIGALSSFEKERFQILIAHNPLYFDEYRKWGADLTVSGHVHGGIIRLPLLGGVISPSIALFPKYDGGMYVKDDKTMILSRGLGTHTIHVRLFNPGEVSVIKVRGKSDVT